MYEPEHGPSWRTPPSALGTTVMLLLIVLTTLSGHLLAQDEQIPRVAVLTTEWRQNSHADMIAGRLVNGYTLDGRGEFPRLKIVSAYVDQAPATDTSRKLAARHGFKIYDTIAGALTLGGDALAVDGVLLIAEHGDYPESPTGQFQFPKRRFWEQVVDVFEKSGRVVPVFHDKHLSDNWADIDWIHRQVQRLKIPVAAGSSLPVTWREPAEDVKRGEPLREILAVSYHRLDAYGFHALEMVQCLAERRLGGETGIRQVRCLEGEAVWEAGSDGLFDARLLSETLSRLKDRPLPPGRTLRDLVPQPTLMLIEYMDGLRASVLTLNGAVAEFAVAWRYADGEARSTLFRLQEDRPLMHFTYLVKGIEALLRDRAAPWPLERTLLTSGALDALLISKKDRGAWLPTPHLAVSYTHDGNWQQPPAPPLGRPLNEETP